MTRDTSFDRTMMPLAVLALAVLAGGGCARTQADAPQGARASAQTALPVVRVSLGRFEPGQLEQVRKFIADSYAPLAPGIRQLRGNLAYYAGIDPATSTIVNVSIWDSLENANQMATFQPMLELGKAAVAAGVRFERPIPNFETLWRLPD